MAPLKPPRTDVEDRVLTLEDKVSELREERAAFKIEMNNLQRDVRELNLTMKDLVSTIDQSKGAIWIIGGISGIIGAIGHWLATLYSGHG